MSKTFAEAEQSLSLADMPAFKWQLAPTHSNQDSSPPIDAKPLCRMKSVDFYYGKNQVLDNVDWQIMPNDFWLILGPNGGGKSTLVELLLGLKVPSSGTIAWQMPLQDLRVGFVPQNTNHHIHMPISVLEMVALGSRKRWGLRFNAAEKTKAMQSLALVDLADLADRRLESLSGGQRQRAHIARALMADPQLLVLDEPTANVDQQGKKDIHHIMTNLSQHTTIVMISHDWPQLLHAVNKMAYVDHQLIEHQTPQTDASVMAQLGLQEGDHVCEIDLLNRLLGSTPRHTCKHD